MVAHDQRLGAAVIVVEVEGRGRAAITADDDRARYIVTEQLHGSMAAVQTAAPHGPVRVLVEVLRRFGGMTPRAMVGGRLVPGAGAETAVEVCVGGSLEGPHEHGLPATLWRRPLIPGLPAEYAAAVLEGLTAHDQHAVRVGLPAGVLVIDRAGFDEAESSTAVFRQAATLLGHVVAAAAEAGDINAAARAAMALW